MRPKRAKSTQKAGAHGIATGAPRPARIHSVVLEGENMLAIRDSRIIEICDLCGEEINPAHAYSDGRNRFCSFDCMAEVNDMVEMAEEWSGLDRNGPDGEGVDDEVFIDRARSLVVAGSGKDIGETDEFSPAEEYLVHPIPRLVSAEYYARLPETLFEDDTKVFVLAPAGDEAGEWRARIYVKGHLKDETSWPRRYSRSFREEIADIVRKNAQV